MRTRDAGRGAPDAPSGSDLQVQITAAPGADLVTLTGNLDIYAIPEFRARVRPLLSAGGDVVLDLTDVGIVDSAGIGALVSLRNELAHDGRRVGLVGERSLRVIGMAGLERAFACARDVPGALRALARGAGGGGPAA